MQSEVNADYGRSRFVSYDIQPSSHDGMDIYAPSTSSGQMSVPYDVTMSRNPDSLQSLGLQQHHQAHHQHENQPFSTNFEEPEQYSMQYPLSDPSMLDDVLIPSSATDFRYPGINSLNVDFCSTFHDPSAGLDRYGSYSSTNDPYLAHVPVTTTVTTSTSVFQPQAAHNTHQHQPFPNAASETAGTSCELNCGESSFDCIRLEDLATFRDDVTIGVGNPPVYEPHHQTAVSYGEDLSTNVAHHHQMPPPAELTAEDVVAATADPEEHMRFVASLPKKRKLPDAVREELNLFSPREASSAKLVQKEPEDVSQPTVTDDALYRDLTSFLPSLLDDLPELGDFELAQLMSTMRKKKGVGVGGGNQQKRPILDLPKKRLRGESFLSDFSSTCPSTVIDAVDVPNVRPNGDLLPYKKRIPKALISESESDANFNSSISLMIADGAIIDEEDDDEDLDAFQPVDEQEDVEKKVKKKPDSGSFECSRCNEVFTSRRSLIAHGKTHIGSFSCQLCGLACGSQAEFFAHLKCHYEEENSKKPRKRKFVIEETPKLQECGSCGVGFENEVLLEAHMKDVHSPEEQRPVEHFEEKPVEKFVVMKPPEIQQEKKSVPKPEPGEFPCTLCEAKFVFKQRLGKHMKNVHGSSLPAKRHKKVDDGAGKTCPHCGQFFSKKNTYYVHLKKHGDQEHVCDVCSKSFKRATLLKRHMTTHTGDKPYMCDVCGQKFRQLSDMRYHKDSAHGEAWKFKCEYCGRGFARKYSYDIHMRIHTGEKDYKCTVCDKPFRTASHLRVHMRIHTKEKPYACPACGKRFRINSDMKRHLAIHVANQQLQKAAAENRAEPQQHSQESQHEDVNRPRASPPEELDHREVVDVNELLTRDVWDRADSMEPMDMAHHHHEYPYEVHHGFPSHCFAQKLAHENLSL